MDHHKRKFDEDASQEKEDAPFKREKVLDEKYKISFHLEPDDEFDEYIQNVSGKVKYEGSTIGRLSAYLFERHNGFAEGFYDICDAPSAETQECSVLFFKDTGKLKGDFAHKASPTCNSGGYLHIVSVEVDEAHRGQGLGLTLLQKCLDHLAGSWTIAMMQPYPLHEKGEAFTRAVVAMGRHFARLGFQKCDTNSASERAKFWFLEGCRYTGQVLHKESVRDLEIILPLSQPTVTEVCEELRKIITQGAGEMTHDLNALSATEEANFKEKMAAVLARGASLDECGALHVAVANKRCHYLRPLIDLGEYTIVVEALVATKHLCSQKALD